MWEIVDRELPMRFLIHDRDAKFTAPFNTVFASEGVETVLTPCQSPKANAFAERWVRTVREECLDQLLIINDAHLRRVLLEYIEYYNGRRPHQGIGQRIPIPLAERRIATSGRVHCRDVLGGAIHDYYRTDTHVV